MTKEDFLLLTDKYNRGECSAEELGLIIDFCERIQDKGIEPGWDLNEEERIRIQLLISINRKIDQLEKGRSRKEHSIRPNSIRIFWRVAAVLLIASSTITWFTLSEKETESVEYLTKTTEKGHRAIITLADGTIVKLNSESTISYPRSFTDLEAREITLSGEAFFDVTENREKTFKVKTDELNAIVLGTTFNVSAYPKDSKINVTLESGKVRVETNQKEGIKRAFEINPGEQVSFTRASREMHKLEVNLRKFTGWKEGIIILEENTIEEASIILERWYDVSFKFSDKDLKACKINGEFKSDNLQNILQNMEFLTGLKFRLVNDDEIIVSGKCK